MGKAAIEPSAFERKVASPILTRVGGTRQTGETGGGALSFTGAPVLRWLAFGAALLAGGLLLWRRTSTARAAVGLPANAGPPGVAPDPPPSARRLPSRGPLGLRSLALLACRMLLLRRRR